jgi:hypothetical protein
MTARALLLATAMAATAAHAQTDVLKAVQAEVARHMRPSSSTDWTLHADGDCKTFVAAAFRKLRAAGITSDRLQVYLLDDPRLPVVAHSRNHAALVIDGTRVIHWYGVSTIGEMKLEGYQHFLPAPECTAAVEAGQDGKGCVFLALLNAEPTQTAVAQTPAQLNRGEMKP